jgi:3-hydroxyisobutyrate dehydrogenase-like beta-hydroxyacid dehydrogenase
VTAQAARTLGFIGLGAMGGPMARRLLDAGYRVLVHDIDAAAVDALADAGAQPRPHARSVADAAEKVLVSLPSPAVVEAVARELAGAAAMRRYVDLSTSGPPAAAAVAALLAGHGVGCVDAPVSGGVAGARSGGLTIMAAGAASDVAAVRPLLEVLGATVFVVGDTPGQGQSVKVINNLMSACSIAITSEAAALGVKAGLDPATLLEVISASSGSNAAAAVKFPRYVLTRTFHQGFRLNLMAKDVRLCLAEARRLGVPMLLGATVEQLWSLGEASFADDADFMEIVQMFERWADARIEASPMSAES